MSQMTREINKITGTIISVSGKLIVYALVILLLVEGMSRGYAFGHEVFYATPMEPKPGTRYAVTIPKGQKPSDTAKALQDLGLIHNEYALRIQMWFYDYEIYPGTYELSTAMTSKEILQALNEKPKEEGQEDGADAEVQEGSGAGGLEAEDLKIFGDPDEAGEDTP